MSDTIRLSDYDYDLPAELIAQHPAGQREESRLLVLDRKSGGIRHRRFRDVIEFLRAGDALALNNTRVLRARLIGRRATGGRVEALLLRELTDGNWEALLKPGARLKTGETVEFENGAIRARLLERQSEGVWLARLEAEGGVRRALESVGRVPLPPYIGRDADSNLPDDLERYQTVYASRPGAVAAPTAGLHFSAELLSEIERKGVAAVYLTLHVGLGTFKPIAVDDVARHKMHSEWFELPEPAAAQINKTRSEGGRIVAVGTTSCRVLETVAARRPIAPQRGDTDIFIYPPYAFRLTDALITNFHLPRTTLLLLVCAFAGSVPDVGPAPDAGRDLILRAYREAVKERYRFYSYGDAMLIL